MSYKQLEKSLKNKIKSLRGDKKQSHFSQMHSHLKNLLKYGLLDLDNFAYHLTDGLPDLLDAYELVLISNQKKTIRTPLSRVRALAKYYNEINNFNTNSLTFSETILEAIDRKYEGIIYKGDVNRNNQYEIRKKFKTYTQVCREIIIAGVQANNGSWDVDINSKKLVSDAAGILQKWVKGDTIPSIKNPKERFLFIEQWFNLPTNTLLNKVKVLNKRSEILHATTTKKKPIEEGTKTKTFVAKKLNTNFKRYYTEYSEYKLYSAPPMVKNFIESDRDNKYLKELLEVKELNGKKEKSWTFGAGGKCTTASNFQYSLRAFISFCVKEHKIKENDVDLHHLTNVPILKSLITSAKKGNIGGVTAARILSIVKQGSQKRGYLRLCGKIVDETLNEYFYKMDFIEEEIIGWIDSAKEAKISRAEGADTGKANIVELLKLTTDEREEVSNQTVEYLTLQAKSNLLEANALMEKLKKPKNEKTKINISKEICTTIKRAYRESTAAMIYKLSSKACLRGSNWTMLKYYENNQVKDKAYPAFTHNTEDNLYDIDIPLRGPDLIYDSKRIIRYLKNANTINACKVEMEFKPNMNKYIELFLEVRAIYINFVIPFEIPNLIDKANESIKILKENGIVGINNSSKKILIDSLKKDIEAYKNFDSKSVLPLIVWLTRKKDFETLDAKKIEGYIETVNWYDTNASARKFMISRHSLSSNFKQETANAFYAIDNKTLFPGINLHAMRHLIAITHLERNKGDYEGVAAILNDDVEQVFKTYGPKNRKNAMKRIAAMD
jgi:hypothetical protein